MGQAPGRAPKPSIGVIETSALWAAADYFRWRISRGRALDMPTSDARVRRNYFLGLLHNLILYDELRTDIALLKRHPARSAKYIEDFLAHLTPGVTLSPMPEMLDEHALSTALIPILVAKTKEVRAHTQARRRSLHSSIQELADDPPLDSYRRFGLRDLMRRIGKRNVNEIKSLASSIRVDRNDIARTASVLIRTVKYAAHASYIKNAENRAAVYCAAPRRIEVMRKYLANPELSSIEFATKGFFDLIGRLGLPAGGYNFSMFAESMNPLPFSELSMAMGRLPPHEALARTMELRDSAGAKKIRAEWARRLWGRSNSSAEGLGQSVTNSVIRGNVTLYQYVATPEELSSIHTAPQTQHVRNTSARGKISQTIEGRGGCQTIEETEAEELSQELRTIQRQIVAEFKD